MTLLKVLVTHLGPVDVERNLEHLAALAPGPVLVCHGGRREDFDALSHPSRVFLEHPGLRGAAATHQSYDEALAAAWHDHLATDPALSGVLVLEFDQIPLRDDFETQLVELMDRHAIDFIGKDCVDRTNTNWWHRVRYRDDPELLAHLRELSVRDDPTTIYGCLGTGFAVRRAALEAMVAVTPPENVYNELYLPTLAHHLGFRVGSVDDLGPLYDHVRWAPPFAVEEALALQRDGVAVIHPFKTIAELDRLRLAVT